LENKGDAFPRAGEKKNRKAPYQHRKIHRQRHVKEMRSVSKGRINGGAYEFTTLDSANMGANGQERQIQGGPGGKSPGGGAFRPLVTWAQGRVVPLETLNRKELIGGEKRKQGDRVSTGIDLI